MDNYFLTLTLFFPRLTLLFYYANAWIPTNTLPFWGDVLMSVFIPRVLVLIYIYQNLGANSVWFWVHVVALILCYAGGSSSSVKRKSD
jgi:hypothetical protein